MIFAKDLKFETWSSECPAKTASAPIPCSQLTTLLGKADGHDKQGKLPRIATLCRAIRDK